MKIVQSLLSKQIMHNIGLHTSPGRHASPEIHVFPPTYHSNTTSLLQKINTTQ